MLEIHFLDSIASTQTYLKQQLANKTLCAPVAVSAELQTNGIGSRENNWSGLRGNLFLSFALSLEQLPEDLKLESASIYFAYLLKEVLAQNGSEVFLKWPNDFYLDEKKIGGVITHLVGDVVVCGIGLNVVVAPKNFETLDIKLDKKTILDEFFKKVEKFPLWKQVFRKYKLEYHRNHNFFTHSGTQKIALKEAVLEDDGSLRINGERVYSLR